MGGRYKIHVGLGTSNDIGFANYMRMQLVLVKTNNYKL